MPLSPAVGRQRQEKALATVLKKKNYCVSLELNWSEVCAKSKSERNVHSCLYHLSSLAEFSHVLIKHSNC